MMALKKPVLLLKDKTLKNLNADLIGKLYKEFNPQSISSTIAPQLKSWLKENELKVDIATFIHSSAYDKKHPKALSSLVKTKTTN